MTRRWKLSVANKLPCSPAVIHNSKKRATATDPSLANKKYRSPVLNTAGEQEIWFSSDTCSTAGEQQFLCASGTPLTSGELQFPSASGRYLILLIISSRFPPHTQTRAAQGPPPPYPLICLPYPSPSSRSPLPPRFACLCLPFLPHGRLAVPPRPMPPPAPPKPREL